MWSLGIQECDRIELRRQDRWVDVPDRRTGSRVAAVVTSSLAETDTIGSTRATVVPGRPPERRRRAGTSASPILAMARPLFTPARPLASPAGADPHVPRHRRTGADDAEHRPLGLVLDLRGPDALACQARLPRRLASGGLRLQARAPLARKSVVVSFDDGFHGHYTKAMPILAKHGWAGTLNLAISHLSRANAFTPRMVRRMLAAELGSRLAHADTRLPARSGFDSASGRARGFAPLLRQPSTCRPNSSVTVRAPARP